MRVIIRVAADDDDDVPALSLVEPLGQASFIRGLRTSLSAATLTRASSHA
jgi:hypothetical protein